MADSVRVREPPSGVARGCCCRMRRGDREHGREWGKQSRWKVLPAELDPRVRHLVVLAPAEGPQRAEHASTGGEDGVQHVVVGAVPGWQVAAAQGGRRGGRVGHRTPTRLLALWEVAAAAWTGGHTTTSRPRRAGGHGGGSGSGGDRGDDDRAGGAGTPWFPPGRGRRRCRGAPPRGLLGGGPGRPAHRGGRRPGTAATGVVGRAGRGRVRAVGPLVHLPRRADRRPLVRGAQPDPGRDPAERPRRGGGRRGTVPAAPARGTHRATSTASTAGGPSGPSETGPWQSGRPVPWTASSAPAHLGSPARMTPSPERAERPPPCGR
ncbi:hypothetical protein SGRIM128S_01582 [Streptomyces griseomycini]